ncbi:epoxide hydrolase family protein [Aeromicrobium massiliense]|uniref:epoxide hydrolase family protein n=1 Tax=Aeromicrobium massiliense TaxID=1464554 RepID=UPI00030DFA66|nr:epoxide hydrolase [Aeromicrobium massiliense]
MTEPIHELDPTSVHVPDAVLDDLRRRLHATRWPDDPANDDGGYGVRRAVLQPLVEYWADGFDWRAAERAINAYEHHRVQVDGVPVHFMRRRGVGPAPVPLLLSHGWPWTFWHWSKVVDRLADPGTHGGDPADAFDVIVPSLPGFGFSTPVDRHPDLSFWRIAEIFHELMTGVLGHERYAAAGCDVGALITGQLGHRHADALHAIHIGSAQRLDLFTGDRAWDVTGGRPLPEGVPDAVRDRVIELERRFAVHLSAQVLAPATLGYALQDSPVGMLAWVLERWDRWSDHDGDLGQVFSRDDLLTHATIIWAGGSIASSMRTYANNNRHPWTPSHDRWPVVEAPTGVTFVAHEDPPGVSTPEERVAGFLAGERADWYRLENVTAHPRGGHFIPWELPEEWTDDLRRTMRPHRPRA